MSTENTESAPKTAPTVTTSPSGIVLVGKSGKKICCACPTTKQLRDECVVTNGPEACAEKIEAHKKCLREDGFVVD
jgi:cytochrome c oxidase assembly protein subunit 17